MLISNHLWVLQPKAAVLSAEEKAGETGQVRVTELNESEEPIKRRQRKAWVETRDFPHSGEESGGNLITDQTAAGVEAAGT